MGFRGNQFNVKVTKDEIIINTTCKVAAHQYI
ncbi:hypothetical protein CS542_01960 [Pedobacter sp. IW39]|nr:hypothetical protein CS542_01960 [Pedobacter sp. IW39]